MYFLSGLSDPVCFLYYIRCVVCVRAQGGMGWYMVKSGLKEETMPKDGVPRVSPYRLGVWFVVHTFALPCISCGQLRVVLLTAVLSFAILCMSLYTHCSCASDDGRWYLLWFAVGWSVHHHSTPRCTYSCLCWCSCVLRCVRFVLYVVFCTGSLLCSCPFAMRYHTYLCLYLHRVRRPLLTLLEF